MNNLLKLPFLVDLSYHVGSIDNFPSFKVLLITEVGPEAEMISESATEF